MNKSFDFTSVPKELIYRDRRYLDDFDVENRASLNYFIYEELYDRFSHFTDFEEFAKAMFNYSYYICTMAIVDDHADRRFGTYRRDIFTAFRYNKTYSGIVLAMVLLQIRIQRWDITPPMIRLADSIEKELKNKEYGELFSEFYLRIKERMNKISPEDLERAPFEEFLPRKINRKVLMDTCSYWDWCKEFGTDEEKKLEFIQAIGKNEDERIIIAQFLREQTDQEKQTPKEIEADYNKQRVAMLEAENSNNNLQIQEKDEKIRLLKEDLEVYQHEPISNNPRDKVRLEVFCKLLEGSGADFDVYGRKAEAARFAQYITGLPFSTCKNYMTNRDLNTTEHAEEVLKTNSSIKSLGIKWQL